MLLNRLERSHYQLLLAIDDHGTISAAAEALIMTQSAASQRLRQAEQRLGIQLTERAGRTVALTPAALRLVRGARQSEPLLRSAEVEAQWLANADVPTLTIAVDAFDTLWWLGSLAAGLDAAADVDRASIRVTRCAVGDGPQWVADGRADVYLGPQSASYVTGAAAGRSLFDDQLVGVVGPTNPLAAKSHLTPADFHDSKYASYSTTPQEGFELDGFLSPHEAIPGHLAEYESVATLLDVIAQGPRISILPRFVIPPDPAVEVRPLTPEPPPVTWRLLSGRFATNGTSQRAFDKLATHLIDAATRLRPRG